MHISVFLVTLFSFVMEATVAQRAWCGLLRWIIPNCVVCQPVCLQGRSQEFANGGTSRRSGGQNPPTGSSGRASVGVWRRSFQKLETNVHVDFENMQNTLGVFLHSFSLLLAVY